MKRKPYPLLYFSTALLCLLAVFGCKGKERQTAGNDLPSVAVQTMTVKTDRSAIAAEIMGTVRSAEKAAIAARISGHIAELPVVLGSKVGKGDLLVKINAGEIYDQLQQAKARLAQADRNLARERSLLSKNASTPETVRSLEDTHRIALAAVKEAQTMFDYATISAPFSGTITRKDANIGDLAVPGKPLLVLEDERQLQVEADIPESMVLRIKVGDSLPVSIPAAGFSSSCKVEEISPAADPLSRTAPIKLSLPASPDIRSGQFARLSLPEAAEKALFIPQSAVLPFGQMERVFIVTDGKARLRLVRTGAKIDDRVEILAGLSPGEVVVTAGNADLLDGQPVTVSR